MLLKVELFKQLFSIWYWHHDGKRANVTVGGIPFPARAEQQGGPCPRPTWGPAHDLMSLHDRVGGVDGRGEHRALPHSLLLHRLECEAQQEGCNYPTFAIIQHTSQPAFKTSSGTSRTTLKQTSSSCLLLSATYQCFTPDQASNLIEMVTSHIFGSYSGHLNHSQHLVWSFCVRERNWNSAFFGLPATFSRNSTPILWLTACKVIVVLPSREIKCISNVAQYI